MLTKLSKNSKKEHSSSITRFTIICFLDGKLKKVTSIYDGKLLAVMEKSNLLMYVVEQEIDMNGQIIKEIDRRAIESKTCLECFNNIKPVKLIETEEEFNEYLKSKLDLNSWCRMKLIKKMKELNLGNGFISAFADLVVDDLNKYKAMVDLAKECSDKDILMYLFVKKFGNENKVGIGNVCNVI